MNARIFDIQRCSYVDGPGIRTTVFFKGCNLRCRWCHNPESQSFDKELLYYPKRCTACGLCSTICPSHACRSDGSVDRAVCVNCGECTVCCPHDARWVVGQDMDTDKIFQELIRDREYYAASGGGVTFSGGECLLQSEAVLCLLKKLRSCGIHCAVDTAGNIRQSILESVLPWTDLFLYDLKCFTEALHRSLTGDGNVQIIANYLYLQRMVQDKLWVRIPIIPNENDVGDEMRQLADFLRLFPPAKVELLPCHSMGEGKRIALGRNEIPLRVPEPARMEELKRLFQV